MTTPFPLILITSPEDFSDEHVLIEAMFRRGLERLHLRKPRKNIRAMERWIFDLDPAFRERVVVHGHDDLRTAFNLAGIHGEDSYSLHSCTELLVFAQPCSYAFLSPIFPSFSKPGYNPAYTDTVFREGIKAWRAQKNHPVKQLYALGGIDAERLNTVREWGFDGAAVLGAVWDAADPLGAWDLLHAERYRMVGLPVPNIPAIESWRDHLVHRRGDLAHE